MENDENLSKNEVSRPVISDQPSAENNDNLNKNEVLNGNVGEATPVDYFGNNGDGLKSQRDGSDGRGFAIAALISTVFLVLIFGAWWLSLSFSGSYVNIASGVRLFAILFGLVPIAIGSVFGILAVDAYTRSKTTNEGRRTLNGVNVVSLVMAIVVVPLLLVLNELNGRNVRNGGFFIGLFIYEFPMILTLLIVALKRVR